MVQDMHKTVFQIMLGNFLWQIRKNQHNVVLHAWVQIIRNCTVSSANPNNTEQQKSQLNTEQIDSDDDLWYPLVNSITNYGTSPFLMGKSTINDHFQ